MVIGKGSTKQTLSDDDVRQIVARALEHEPLEGKRLLVIIPDSTRTAPIPLMFRTLNDLLRGRVSQIDYLIALGTHPPMSEEAISRLVGMSGAERAKLYPNVRIFNHRWDLPETLRCIGVIDAADIARVTNGMLREEAPVTLNGMILDYDRLLICGPVFPHEVVGFSGGAKYLFPGIAGPDIINATHWLGALVTSMYTIGVKDTPVRAVIHRAAEFVPRQISCLAMVMQGHELHGLYFGGHLDAWHDAAVLSEQLNVIHVAKPFHRVLSMPSEMYDDLWTAAKAMYKTEPAIADGGEVIIYAPHLTEISYVHGKLIDEVGYHVRDYFLKQPERFKHVPGTIKAHSTHVKGAGAFETKGCIESPRIQVTLATGIPEERCHKVNLGYADYRDINPRDWAGREDEGVLLVPHAGEMLYRAATLFSARSGG